jgi:membrane protein involved in colicin uptake
MKLAFENERKKRNYRPKPHFLDLDDYMQDKISTRAMQNQRIDYNVFFLNKWSDEGHARRTREQREQEERDRVAAEEATKKAYADRKAAARADDLKVSFLDMHEMDR